MKLNLKIKQYLKQHYIKPVFLAEKLKVPPSKIYRMLRGEQRITAEEFLIICSALGVASDYFLTDNA